MLTDVTAACLSYFTAKGDEAREPLSFPFIARKIMSLFVPKWLLLFVPDQCLQSAKLDTAFVLNCTKHIASRGLSSVMIIASFFYRVPQILKIVRNKSARGVSFASLAYEAVCYAFNISYFYSRGHGLMLYGENFVSLAQSAILAFLLWRYREVSGGVLVLSIAVLGAFLAVTAAGVLPRAVVDALYLSSAVAYVASRGMQCAAILKCGSSRNLSLTTLSLSALGCLGRLITLLFDTRNDRKAVGVSALLLAVSTAMLLLAVVYKDRLFNPTEKRRSG